MKEKLINIKLILKIVISLFVIISCVKSCSKAYTWDEFLEYTQQLIDDTNTNASIKSACRGIIKFKNNLINTFSQNGINVYSKESFMVDHISDGGWCEIIVYSGIVNIGVSGTSYRAPVSNCIRFTPTNSSYNGSYSSLSDGGWYDKNHIYGLVNNNDGNTYTGTYINQYVPPITFEFQPEGQQVDYQNYTDKPWAVQNSYSNSSWSMGEFIDYAEYKYIDNYLFDSEGNTIANYRYYVGATNSQNSNLFINTDELYIKSRLLNYGQIYSLALYCYDSDENMDSYTYNYIFLPLNANITAGVITDFGSGDYTIQNSTNDIIENQEEKQKEEENFLVNLYNNLMKPSGEEIKNALEDTMEELEILQIGSSGEENGELERALAFLDQINEYPEDFVISWTPKNTHFTINNQPLTNQLRIETEDNKINFSKLERENEDLHEAMIYARAIISFSVFSLFFANVWKTILTTLGIGTTIYEKTTEEQRIARNNEEKWKQELEKQKYREWLRSHKK